MLFFSTSFQRHLGFLILSLNIRVFENVAQDVTRYNPALQEKFLA